MLTPDFLSELVCERRGGSRWLKMSGQDSVGTATCSGLSGSHSNEHKDEDGDGQRHSPPIT